MIKKEIELRPLDSHPLKELFEPPKTQTMESISELSMDEANKLCHKDKRRWCEEMNRTANLYFINPKGMIQRVEPSGWWY